MNCETDQLKLFEPMLKAYAQRESLTNDELYEHLSRAEGIPQQAWAERRPIGRSGEKHSPMRRRVRWMQQTLKRLGLLERPGARGVWRATDKAKAQLTQAKPRQVMLAFSTDLGLALYGRCQDVFARIDEPIQLMLSSPPYPLQRPRAYGGPTEGQYVDFICEALEPVVRNLAAGGAIALNLSNDIFVPGSPERSLYRERLVIALHDRLGLRKVDELIWHNPSKAPGPIAWASKQRMQLNTAYEPVYVFTNDPLRLRASNQRVLQPHTEQHRRLIERGGERRTAVYGDGALRLRHGSFGKPTAGRIPRNVLTFGHRCADNAELRRIVQAEGLPPHPATMPKSLAKFLVEYLSEPGDLVADLFAGWFTTAAAAQELGRRWIACEAVFEYVLGASHRTAFRAAPGFATECAAGTGG